MNFLEEPKQLVRIVSPRQIVAHAQTEARAVRLFKYNRPDP